MNALLTQARSRGGLLSFARFLGLALIGSGILAASAQVTVPMWPVPATLQSLAVLRSAVDAFFDSVMVMADDAALRANRLALLKRMQGLFMHAADLSRLPG